LNARELDSYLSRIDEAYNGESELGGPVHGREGVRQNLEATLSAFPDLKLEAEHIIASGNTVVTRFGIAPTNKSIAFARQGVEGTESNRAFWKGEPSAK
jgi:predicted ester cyclase